MEQLRILRESKGLSQAKLAAQADMNPATIWRIETGRRSPTIEQLERLARVLDAEITDFFPKAQAPLWPEGKAGPETPAGGEPVALDKALEDLDVAGLLLLNKELNDEVRKIRESEDEEAKQRLDELHVRLWEVAGALLQKGPWREVETKSSRRQRTQRGAEDATSEDAG